MCLGARTSGLVVVGIAALAGIAGALATGQPSRSDKPAAAAPAGQPELPPGVNFEDLQACIAAGTPGEQHEFLAGRVGVWRGKSRMWMSPVPGAEPLEGACTWTVTSIMDGRYIKCELLGELPGLGSFSGLGLTGFDNVSQKFVSDWIDNHSTGIMNGVGELSADRKVLTWRFTYNCPIRNKPATVRQIETCTGAGAMTFEMFTTDPRSGNEYRCMQVDFAKEP